MALYEDKTHITKIDDLKRELRHSGLSHEDQKRVLEKLEPRVHGYNGMSQEEFQKEVRVMLKNTKDKIDPRDAAKLRRLGK